MNLEILIKGNEKLVHFSDSSIVYKTFDNEYGEYYELEGQIIIIFDDENIITIDTITLESDLYSFFYSVNDYIELGSAGIVFNIEEIELQYYKFEDGKLSIEILGKSYLVSEEEFFYGLLNTTSIFFQKLYVSYSDNKYKMYLELINTLKSKVFIN